MNAAQNQLQGDILIISGWRGAGKTTLCRRLIEAARSRGWQVSGLLCPAVVVDGVKTGIEVENLQTQEHRLLAHHSDTQPAEIRTKGYAFDSIVLEWGNEILKNSQTSGLFVMDELGPLELIRNEGWTEGIYALDRRAFRLALVVIRPELLQVAEQRWSPQTVVQVEDIAQIPQITQEILDRYFK